MDQYYIRVKEHEKFDTMTRLMDVDQPELSIVFGRTKRRVDELTRGLKLRGFRAEGIHGDWTTEQAPPCHPLLILKMTRLMSLLRRTLRRVVWIFQV